MSFYPFRISVLDYSLIVERRTMSDELLHYGVKGMRWGVRNDRRSRKERRSSKRVSKARKTGDLSKLSMSELESLSKRLNEESRALAMMPKAQKRYNRRNKVKQKRSSSGKQGNAPKQKNDNDNKKGSIRRRKNHGLLLGAPSSVLNKSVNGLTKATGAAISAGVYKKFVNPRLNKIFGAAGGSKIPSKNNPWKLTMAELEQLEKRRGTGYGPF